MAEEKKEEKKEEKSCCCGHEHEGGKCCCKYKKFFPHNWFKLKCLTRIFYVFFYICAIAAVYVLVSLIMSLTRMSWAEIKYSYADIFQAVTGWFTLVIFTFLMLAVAKICKTLRKIKKLVKGECKEENRK